jgi:hypothetical protein
MTPQDMQALQNFLTQLVQARGVAKDPQADSLIAGAVAQQPDAAYLLVQRVLMVEQALERAKAQIASLQSQLQAAQSPPARGFLDAETWGNTSAAPVRPAVSAPMAPTLMQPQFAAMPPQAPPAPSGFFSGGLGGTLGTVAATAAGVAGGALLFQGIGNMMHPRWRGRLPASFRAGALCAAGGKHHGQQLLRGGFGAGFGRILERVCRR